MALFELSRYHRVAHNEHAARWLRLLDNYGRAPNTLCAYAQALDQFFGFCRLAKVRKPIGESSEVISLFVRWLQGRHPTLKQPGCANATVVQRLAALRLFHEHLVYEGVINKNPVRRGSRRRGRYGVSALVSQQKRLPWIPDHKQWQQIVRSLAKLSHRDQLMGALAYDAALRRGELVSVAIEDFDLSRGVVTVRAEHSKSGADRAVPLSSITRRICAAYFRTRRLQSLNAGPLFLSLSPRNRNKPISISTWTKIVERLRDDVGLPRLTTHTFRHLRLTDLARSNWEIQKIARFAGHRSIESSMRYIHLSARDLRDGIQEASADLRLRALTAQLPTK